MKTHDENGVINPDFVLASGRADSLVSEALVSLRHGDYATALERLKDAKRWIEDLNENDP